MPMRPLMAAAGLLCAMPLTLPLASADDLPRRVTVTGSGAVTAAPDTARMTMSVQHRSLDLQVARNATAKVSSAFIALCTRLGIKPAKVRSSGLSIQPEYQWNDQTKKQVFTGYFVQRQLEVELDNLDLLGSVLEGAIEAGVNDISPPQLDSSKRREFQRDALAAAAVDARANAQRIADTLGVTLGRVVNVTTGDGALPPQPMGMPMLRVSAMSTEGGAPASYVTGELSFENRVNATFEVGVP